MSNDLISKSHFDKRVREAVGMTITELTADFKDGVRTTLELLKTEPTVDAVVVRCGECKYYDEQDHNCLDEMAYARCWMPTDFCSFGERREDDG